MAMPQAKVWTLEELYSLPDDGNKYELLHGELFVTPPPAPDHETAIARLHALLVPFVMAHGLGLVYSGNPAIQEAGSLLIPDLLVRQPPAAGSSWDSAPIPSLVVEALSPSTRKRDYEYKRPFYINEVGVPEYWIVDTAKRSFTVFRSGVPEVVALDRVTWAPVGASATLEIKLAEVFGS